MSATERATTPSGGDLNSTLLFRGRNVVARERATYPHPKPSVKTLATSSVVDVVLLDDGAEVLQCCVCGDTSWTTVRSAVAHAGSHARKTSISRVIERQVSEERIEVHASRRRERTVTREMATPSSPREFFDQLEGARIQLTKLQLSVNECLTRLRRVEKELRTTGDAAELSEVREKARRFDELHNLLS